MRVYYTPMLSISHTLTGALVAAKLPNPLIYIPITLATHYLEDWIPHWDVGTGLSSGKRKKSTAIKLELIELGISVVLLYFFWQHQQPLNIHIWIAAFVSLIPDFLEAPRNFLKWEPFFLKPFNEFHGLFHNSVPSLFVGLAPQIILWIIIWFLR